ncbi:MAG TPA: extracellular solute-binding protein [Candidatus Korarchaeota archaeon]|nr:extracellular solute-binding protein [Candidatus Korarchaeota archaeon]
MPVGWRLKAVVIALAILLAASLAGLMWLQGRYSGTLRVTTTTSLYATGLLDLLADEFQEKYPGVSVQFIPVGSGEALRRASLGDADAVTVHAPSLEAQYIEEGYLVDGRIFAYNHFIVVGPPEDPAGVSGADPVEAMRRIYEAGERGEALFVSRGDNSGTHVKELSLWEAAGLDPRGRPWYIESGSGMSQTLMLANEKRAYTLSDIGTYLKMSEKLPELTILLDRGEELINIYSVYVVNPDKVPGVNYRLAKAFADFLSSKEVQDLIASYGTEEFGRPLFYPTRGDPTGELREAWERLAVGG